MVVPLWCEVIQSSQMSVVVPVFKGGPGVVAAVSGQTPVRPSYNATSRQRLCSGFVLCVYPEILLGSSRPRQEKLPAHNFARIFRSNPEGLL
jgi:hypothetical protein